MTSLEGRVSDPAGSGYALALALLFHFTGCILLLLTGPTLGTLHAFAAFIVLAVVAALNQLLPVLTHAPVAPAATVVTAALAFAIGFALLIAGFYGAPTFAPASIILGVTALLWIGWNIGRLIAGKAESQTRWLMLCAILGFAVAAGAGVSMAGAFGQLWTAPVGTLAPLHATAIILGFASLLILAVSYRFVPMFAVAHATAYGRYRIQWIAVAGVAATAAFINTVLLLRLGLALLLVVAAVIGRSHLKTLATRLRKRLDVSLRYASVAWSFGMLALAFALAATWQHAFAVPAIVLGVLGWISTTILGYAYKVAGFLAWQTAKDRDPAAQLPALSTAVNLPLAYLALTLLTCGMLSYVGLSLFDPQQVRLGYDLYAGGGLCALVGLARLPTVYLWKLDTRGTAHSAR